MDPMDRSAPSRGNIHLYYHNIQISFSLIPLSQSKLNFVWSILRKGEGRSLYEWSRSHDQDRRHDYKKQKPLKIFFSRTKRPVILKLGMKHHREEFYKVDIKHDLGMTLTYFMARPT